MDKKEIQAAKLKIVQDAIEQVRRMGDDPPQSKKPKQADRSKGKGVRLP